jgi:hypothetical protein
MNTADAASLRKDLTGVNATVFVLTRDDDQPRILIGHSLNAADAFASVRISDLAVTGDLPPDILAQASSFIERTQPVLIAYWHYEIDTAEMIGWLKPPDG